MVAALTHDRRRELRAQADMPAARVSEAVQLRRQLATRFLEEEIGTLDDRSRDNFVPAPVEETFHAVADYDESPP